jgi:hypothetical protein
MNMPQGPRLERAGLFGLCLLLMAAALQPCAAGAQTWSRKHQRPALFQIIALDASGESGWPFGAEDVAGDGIKQFDPDEAAVDLRSVYADARTTMLWLRAYVSDTVAPRAGVVAFFFIDSDAQIKTGGKAEGSVLWPAFSADPSGGGYERAIGLRGDGSLLGVFFWDAKQAAWIKQPERPSLATLETGLARDPLRLGGDDHAYFQVQLPLASYGLDLACTGTIFVRIWNDAPGNASFGDDDANAALCQPRLNLYGDPLILQSAACSGDGDCPAQSRCRQGVCLIDYECEDDTDCRDGERCSGGSCQRVVTAACTDGSDCDGLVCSAQQCVACSDTGATSCASDRLCEPNGSCVKPSDRETPASSAPPNTNGTLDADGGGRVRGGSFTCSLQRRGAGSSVRPWLLGFVAALLLRRRRRAAASSRRGDDR